MAEMKAARAAGPGKPLEVVRTAIPEPSPDEIRIHVSACGVCHSDAFVQQGVFPWIEYPRIPGHEVVGRIDAVGANIADRRPGERVGVGWHGGHCFRCEACRRGDFPLCRNARVCGVSYDGGYAEYMTAPAEALVDIPDSFDSTEAAPLLCAGVTVFGALRHSGARPGDRVAVAGVGGLGHLAIQYSRRMGFETVAVTSRPEKAGLARELGADHVVAGEDHPGKALRRLGGARVILATAPSAETMSALVKGLGDNGELLIVGADMEPIRVAPFQLISRRASIRGWPCGAAADSADALAFSTLAGVAAHIETYPLDRAAEAYERMMTNRVRFRAVLTMD